MVENNKLQKHNLTRKLKDVEKVDKKTGEINRLLQSVSAGTENELSPYLVLDQGIFRSSAAVVYIYPKDQFFTLMQTQ